MRELTHFIVIDVNECEERDGVCRLGTCINVVGSYSCRCDHGYKLSPRQDSCEGKVLKENLMVGIRYAYIFH